MVARVEHLGLVRVTLSLPTIPTTDERSISTYGDLRHVVCLVSRTSPRAPRHASNSGSYLEIWRSADSETE